MTEPHVVLPGGTIGMLGGGQLGRMFAMAAHAMGYHVIVFDSEPSSPAAQVADEVMVARFGDYAALRSFAERCDCVSLEWENVPTLAIEAVSSLVPTFPSANVLRVAQDRRREKGTLADSGLPVTPFASVHGRYDLERAATELGLPIVLKTATCGYDGKGQRMVRDSSELRDAFDELGGGEMVAEQWISYRRELSVIVARNAHGQTAVYPLFENDHVNHILDTTICPAPGSEELRGEAEKIAIGVVETLQVVGLLCVELFETADGKLLINEIAPRPHNSGHLTIEAAVTSQFEQHVRAVCGLPLGSTEVRRPAAMVNLLGDLWEQGNPNMVGALSIPDAHLHLYGKSEPRTGRKMGHITALGADVDEAVRRARRAREAFC